MMARKTTDICMENREVLGFSFLGGKFRYGIILRLSACGQLLINVIVP